MNHLAFGLVVSVVVSAVVLDLVSTPDAHVLIPVLAHLASHVVLVLDETAVVLDPFLIAVFAIATGTVMVIVFLRRRLCRWLLLCQVLLSGYTMVGWERSSGSSPPNLTSIYRISRSAGDDIRSCSFAHLIAVAR